MKRVMIIVAALMPLMLMAQARIGIVNSQQLFDLMPEKIGCCRVSLTKSMPTTRL